MHVPFVQYRREINSADIRTLSLASLGGALEFYDFVIFVFFTSVIGKLFFPADMPEWLRQLQIFGLFAAGYLARPLGGVIIAHVGDLHGRKQMFTLSVLLMAIPTLLIGLLPTYQSIGVAAPLLLLVMRIMQGAAIGGEAPGGWVFVSEHVAPGRVGFATGLLTGGLTGGLLLGSLVATVFNWVLTPDQIAGGFWRLPFLAGGVFGFGAMFLRRWLAETPVFEDMRMRAAISQELPLRVVLRAHGNAVLVSMASTWMLTAAIVVVILMTPSLLQSSLGLTPGETLPANLAGTAALCLSAITVGAATDRFGIRRTIVPTAALLVAATYALYLGAVPWLVPLYVLAGAGAGAAAVTPVVMIRAFPPAVRFSGLSFSYNVAYAVFGGTTPLLVSWLAHLDRLAPAHYMAAVALVGTVAVLLAPAAERPPA
jgi:MFS family permease